MDAVLTAKQLKALRAIAKTKLAKRFYFSGGTALAYFYLRHRRSEDLDFFCETEFRLQDITPIIKTIKKDVGFSKFDLQSSFNRNIYQLIFDPKSFLKIEFTYFPFANIEKPIAKEGILVDSLLDIAVNKLFTIAQNPRGRDYYDLYSIEKKQHYGLEKLRSLARQKFDWQVDPLQLGTQLVKVGRLLDDPILGKSMSEFKTKLKDVIAYFEQEAKKLRPEILQ